MARATRRYDVIAFDLDGTLVDTTALHVAASRAATLQVFGEPASPAQIAQSLGRPLQDSLTYLSGGRGELGALVLAYMDYYAAHENDGARLFAGVPELLGDLRAAGLRLALLSNKLRAWGQPEIVRLGIASCFELAVFMEDMPTPKPSGLALRPILERLVMQPGRVLVIGDSPGDMACAQAAGAGSGAALWGVLDAGPLLATHPAERFATLDDVRALIHEGGECAAPLA